MKNLFKWWIGSLGQAIGMLLLFPLIPFWILAKMLRDDYP